jgi:phage terminase large subunit GpA-like protein
MRYEGVIVDFDLEKYRNDDKSYIGLLAQMCAPPPTLTVSQWADNYRKLSSESSAEPGQWYTDRAAFQRGIMDAINDPTIWEIWVKKSAQIGWTEIINNAIGYFMDQDPSPMLLVQPTGSLADAFSKDRLNPMLQDTPRLRGKVSDERVRSKERGNTIKQKRFPGGSLAIIGANSPANLASRPIRVVLYDEIDRYPINVGKLAQREGDVISLGKKRTTTFWNRKILGGSTPTIKGISAIEYRYESSDKRRYFVHCPNCNHAQYLVWTNMKWRKNEHGVHLPETAAYMCEKCAELIDERYKHSMVLNGYWKATAPFNRIAGFHIWEAYSPWVSWPQMVELFLKSKDKPEDLQTFVNTSLGETWQDKGAEVDPTSLPGRVEPYDDQHIPGEVLLLTLGVDVQDNRLEAVLWGWGRGERSYRIQRFTFRGDPSQGEVWAELDKLISRKFMLDDGRSLYIEATCVDSGGHHTQMVYTYCIQRKQYRVFAIKGSAGTGKLAWPKHPSEVKNSNAELFVIGVDTIKDVFFTRLVEVTERGAPGYVSFGATCDAAIFRELTSEVKITKYLQGRYVNYWVAKHQLAKGDPNRAKRSPQEELDCAVYAFAAKESRAADLEMREAQRLNRIEENAPIQQIPLGGANPPATQQSRHVSTGFTIDDIMGGD